MPLEGCGPLDMGRRGLSNNPFSLIGLWDSDGENWQRLVGRKPP